MIDVDPQSLDALRPYYMAFMVCAVLMLITIAIFQTWLTWRKDKRVLDLLTATKTYAQITHASTTSAQATALSGVHRRPQTGYEDAPPGATDDGSGEVTR